MGHCLVQPVIKPNDIRGWARLGGPFEAAVAYHVLEEAANDLSGTLYGLRNDTFLGHRHCLTVLGEGLPSLLLSLPTYLPGRSGAGGPSLTSCVFLSSPFTILQSAL